MSDPKVIPRPAKVESLPGSLQRQTPVRLHREIARGGQRIVVDLFFDVDKQRIVERVVDMATGKVVWVAHEPDDTSVPQP